MPEEATSEAHVPAERPQAREAPRIPASHVDPGRSRHLAQPARQGPGPAVGLIGRIRDRRTFVALRRDGVRVRRGPLGLSYLPSTDPGPPQVAFALTRRVGTAVVRNRLRRRLRAALVESASGSPLEPGAYVVTAGPEASSLTYQELQHNVAMLLTALAERLHEASAR